MTRYRCFNLFRSILKAAKSFVRTESSTARCDTDARPPRPNQAVGMGSMFSSSDGSVITPHPMMGGPSWNRSSLVAKGSDPREFEDGTVYSPFNRKYRHPGTRARPNRPERITWDCGLHPGLRGIWTVRMGKDCPARGSDFDPAGRGRPATREGGPVKHQTRSVTNIAV